MLTLLQTYLDYFLSMIDMQGWFFLILWTVLLYNNFQYTEVLYAFMVEEGFDRSSTHIEAVLGGIQTYMNDNYAGIISYIKLSVSSIVVLLLSFMPSQIQPVLNVMFSGVSQY